MRSETTYLFWWSYVVFLSTAWKNVGMTYYIDGILLSRKSWNRLQVTIHHTAYKVSKRRRLQAKVLSWLCLQW